MRLPPRLRWFAHASHWVLSFAYYLHWIFGTAGVALLFAFLSGFFTKHHIIAFVLGALALLLFVAGTYAWNQKKRWGEFLNPDLNILSYECTYKLDQDLTFARLVVRAKLEVLHDGIDHLKHRLHWTGSGNVSFKPKRGITSVEGPSPDTTGLWHQYRLNFPNALKQGAVHDVEFSVDAQDPQRKARPFVNKFTNDRFIGPFRLRAILPVGVVTQARKEILPHVGATNAASDWDVVPDEFTGDILWAMPKVKLFKVYQISWSATDR